MGIISQIKGVLARAPLERRIIRTWFLQFRLMALVALGHPKRRVKGVMPSLLLLNF